MNCEQPVTHAREAKRSLTAAAGRIPSCVEIWRERDTAPSVALIALRLRDLHESGCPRPVPRLRQAPDEIVNTSVQVGREPEPHREQRPPAGGERSDRATVEHEAHARPVEALRVNGAR